MNNDKGKLYYGVGLDNAQLRADANESKNIIRGIGDSAASEGNRIDGIYRKIGGTIAAVFTVQQAAAFAKSIVQVRGEIESLEISFQTLLGNKQKADALFSEIRTFASNTPMQLNDLAKGAQMLLSFNVEAERVMPILKQIGDIAMGDSQKFNSLTLAFSQMSSTGKLMGQDLLQMINAGFNPLSVMSEKTGKSVAQLKEEMAAGAITSEMVADAFAAATAEGGKFYGMLEKQSKGINGSISNLKGAIQDMFNELGTSNQKFITDSIQGATNIVKHYEEIGRVIGVLITSYGTYKAAVIAYAVAQKVAVSAGNIKAFFELAKGIKTAKDAQIALNLAIGANPFVKLASILMAIGGLIWAFSKNTSAATDEITGLNKAMKDAGAEFEKEAAKVEALQSVMNNSKVAYDERKRALNELKSIIPEYHAELTTEGLLINNNTSAIKDYLIQLEKQIKLKAAQDELEEAYRQKRQLEKEYDEKYNTWSAMNTNSAYYDKPIIDVLGLLGGRDIQKAEREKNEAAAKLRENASVIAELNREIETTGTTTGGRASDGISTFAEQLQAAANKVSTLKTQLASLKAGEGNEPDFAKAIKDKQEELSEAEQGYNLLLGIDKKYLKEKISEFEKAEQEVRNLQQRAKDDLYNEEIALKRKQITDKIKLIEFDRDTTIAAIEAEREAYLQLAVASGAKRSDVDTSIYDKRIETVKVSAELDTDNVNIEEADKIKAKLEALKQEFETYEQERTRIQAEYAAKRKQMYEDDGETLKNGFNQGNLDELDRLQTETLNAVDLEIASREASFNTWINRLVGLGLEQLKEALETARQTLDRGGENLSDKEKAALRAKIVALEKQIDVENTKSPEQQAAEKSKKQWGDTIKIMNGVQETVGNIINSFDGLDEATKQALSAATNIAGGIIGMISGIQALAVTGEEAIKGVERASVILAIIGTAVQIITAIFNLAGAAEKRHQEALAEVARNKLAMQREYNQLLFEQNLLLKEATSVFGVDEITKAINAFKLYRDQLSKYKAELKGSKPAMNFFEIATRDMFGSYNKRLNDYKSGIGALNEIAIKTGHVKTGLFGWGKGRDIYTPILEVYDDIIDKEGNLNIERAKAIIATQKLSEEDKARLQGLIDLQENADKAKEELNSYLESTFGDLGGNIMDAITDGITNGTDAWKEFGKTGASVLEKLGKQIAYELFFSEKFKKLQAQLSEIYGSGKSPEEVAADARNAVADFYNGIGSDMQNAENWLKQWQSEAEKQGLDLWTNEQREASNKGFASMSQDSADELNGRFTVIQGHTYDIREAVNAIALKKSEIDISSIEANIEYLPNISANVSDIQESTKILADNSKNTLELLLGIESNTGRLHSMGDDIADVRMGVIEMRQTVNDIALKGIKLK